MRGGAVALVGAVAGGQRLDDRRGRVLGLRGDELEQRRDHVAELARPAAAVALGVDDRLDRRRQHPDPVVHRGDEAVLLVVEELVEGRARDAGALDHLGDRRRGVGSAGADDRHRLQQPLALRVGDVLAREPVATRGQPPRLARLRTRGRLRGTGARGGVRGSIRIPAGLAGPASLLGHSRCSPHLETRCSIGTEPIIQGPRALPPAELATGDPLEPGGVVGEQFAQPRAQRSGSSGFGAAPRSGSWTIRSTSQRSDSGRRSKLRSSARSPGRRTARSMSRKPPSCLAAAGLPLALELRRGEAGVDAAELEHARASSPRARSRSSSRATISDPLARRRPRGRARAASRSGCGAT